MVSKNADLGRLSPAFELFLQYHCPFVRWPRLGGYSREPCTRYTHYVVSIGARRKLGWVIGWTRRVREGVWGGVAAASARRTRGGSTSVELSLPHGKSLGTCLVGIVSMWPERDVSFLLPKTSIVGKISTDFVHICTVLIKTSHEQTLCASKGNEQREHTRDVRHTSSWVVSSSKPTHSPDRPMVGLCSAPCIVLPLWRNWVTHSSSRSSWIIFTHPHPHYYAPLVSRAYSWPSCVKSLFITLKSYGRKKNIQSTRYALVSKLIMYRVPLVYRYFKTVVPEARNATGETYLIQAGNESGKACPSKANTNY